MKKILGRLLGVVVALSLVCSMLPTTNAQAKSKYTWDKKFNKTVKSNLSIVNVIDKKWKQLKAGNYLEVGEKFKITFKNFPEGAKLSVKEYGGSLCSNGYIYGYTYNNLGEEETIKWNADPFDWLVVKCKDNKATVYVKEPLPIEDIAHDIHMNQAGTYFNISHPEWGNYLYAYSVSLKLTFEIEKTDGEKMYVGVQVPCLNIQDCIDKGFDDLRYFQKY
ncbi:MAG: hypothetical protein K6E95_00655 [Lachnospiraceae bacterium]|nr:hypothetical protein [Lachnospiraceae bacterium]